MLQNKKEEDHKKTWKYPVIRCKSLKETCYLAGTESISDILGC